MQNSDDPCHVASQARSESIPRVGLFIIAIAFFVCFMLSCEHFSDVELSKDARGKKAMRQNKLIDLFLSEERFPLLFL